MSAEGTPSETPGHKQLSLTEIAAIQGFRRLGNHIENECRDTAQSCDVDPRWMAIARTHFQEGLMAAVRAVTKPDFF